MNGVGGLRVIAAVAAAAAIAAAVTVSLVVTDRPAGSGPVRSAGRTADPCATASATHGTTPSATLPALEASAPAALAGVPPLFVVITQRSGSPPPYAVVRATATGDELATIAAPRPYGTFGLVTAAANDRTFVLAAQPWPTYQGRGPTRFFLLCLNAAGQPTERLKPLPMPPMPASDIVYRMALSPDASRLAVAVATEGKSLNTPGKSQIVVFTLATGSARAWSLPTTGDVGSALSWTANGQTLAFQFSYRNGLFTQLRLLRPGAPGGRQNSSGETVKWTADGFSQDALIVPDGTKIVCVTGNPPYAVVTYYSVRTGKRAGFQRVNNAAIYAGFPSPVTAVAGVDWSSTTGSTLLVSTLQGEAVLTAGHLTPIPFPNDGPLVPLATAW